MTRNTKTSWTNPEGHQVEVTKENGKCTVRYDGAFLTKGLLVEDFIDVNKINDFRISDAQATLING